MGGARVGEDHPAVDLSVVVSTYNRAGMLRDALQSILESGESADFEWEIVVVDNNSSDDTKAVVESLSKSVPRIRYVFEPRQGLSFARNTGVERSRGDFLLFTDDDVIVDRNWLTIAFERLSHPGIDFVFGRILPRWTAPKPDWLEDDLRGPLGICDYGGSVVEVGQSNALLPMGGNFAVRRKVILHIGEFHTGLGVRGRPMNGGGQTGCLSGEDYEFGLRMIEAGHRGLYLPSLVVHNRIEPYRLTKDYYRRWVLSNGKSYAVLTQGRDGHFKSWFGVPRFRFREAGQALVGWVGSAARGDMRNAFRHELGFRWIIGFVSKRWSGMKSPFINAKEC